MRYLITLLVILSLALTGCVSPAVTQGNQPPTGNAFPPTPAPTLSPLQTPRTGPAPAPNWFNLEIRPALSKQTHIGGETIDIQVNFTNKSGISGVISPFPSAIDISRKGGKSVFSTKGGNETFTLQPEETKTYHFIWDQKGDDGNYVEPGWYNIQVESYGWSTAYPNQAAYLTRGFATLLILYPQGAMENTLYMNESRTVGGITITLTQVDMTHEYTKFVFSVPPNVPIPTYPPGPLPPSYPDGVFGYALYKLQGGTVKEVGSGESANAISLNPIPSDAHVLTIVITRFTKKGRIVGEGPWEFNIPLQ